MTQQNQQTVANPNATSNQNKLSDADKKVLGTKMQGIIAALVIVVLVVLGGIGGFTKSALLLCVIAGAAGGLIHDLIQNKAVVLLPAKTVEGVYLGWVLGIILGGAAGFIAYAGLSATTLDAKTISAALAAGIALKGITDAAANQPASNIQTS